LWLLWFPVGSASSLSSGIGEELVDFGRELVWVLEEEAVVGVGANDELGVGDAAVQQVRVDGGHQDVVVAVGNERSLVIPAGRASLLMSGCPSQGSLRAARRGGQRLDLVAVLFAGEDPSDELLPFGLAGLRWCEQEVKDVLGAVDILEGMSTDFLAPNVHVASALGLGAGEDQAAQQDRF
jgi:hypothetical protein